MLDFLAEQRIAEAVSRGELDDLPERFVAADAGDDAAARAKGPEEACLASHAD